jgi:hypothetical protein
MKLGKVESQHNSGQQTIRMFKSHAQFLNPGQKLSEVLSDVDEEMHQEDH